MDYSLEYRNWVHDQAVEGLLRSAGAWDSSCQPITKAVTGYRSQYEPIAYSRYPGFDIDSYGSSQVMHWGTAMQPQPKLDAVLAKIPDPDVLTEHFRNTRRQQDIANSCGQTQGNISSRVKKALAAARYVALISTVTDDEIRAAVREFYPLTTNYKATYYREVYTREEIEPTLVRVDVQRKRAKTPPIEDYANIIVDVIRGTNQAATARVCGRSQCGVWSIVQTTYKALPPRSKVRLVLYAARTWGKNLLVPRENYHNHASRRNTLPIQVAA